MQTRKCHAHANANADANADSNRIRTKNNMSPPLRWGTINDVSVYVYIKELSYLHDRKIRKTCTINREDIFIKSVSSGAAIS